MMSTSDDDALTGLYTQRQDILKQLAEVDAKIKSLEGQMADKEKGRKWRSAEDGAAVQDNDVLSEKASVLVAKSMQDANGLREAQKAVMVCATAAAAPASASNNAEEGAAHEPDCADSSDDTQNDVAHFRASLVREAFAHCTDLSMDPNGSEFLQNLCGILRSDHVASECAPGGSASEVAQLVLSFGANFHAVCCSTNGARVTQRIVDALTSIGEFLVVSRAVSSRVVELAKDINGNHTLSKLITSARFKSLEEDLRTEEATAAVQEIYRNIFQSLSDNCVETCKNRQGCCIIQKCLQWSPEPFYEQILSTVLTGTLRLVQDPFANYVVQFILDQQGELKKRAGCENTNYTNQIIRQMLHHVADLSCNKFSSNVVEKCLKLSSTDVRQLLVDELTDPQVLPKLLTDSYANYVIQTAIVTASDDGQFAQIREAITPLQNLLKNSPYGVKIEAKLSRRSRENPRRPKKRDSGHGHSHGHGPSQHQQLRNPHTHQQQSHEGGAKGGGMALHTGGNLYSGLNNPNGDYMGSRFPAVSFGNTDIGINKNNSNQGAGANGGGFNVNGSNATVNRGGSYFPMGGVTVQGNANDSTSSSLNPQLFGGVPTSVQMVASNGGMGQQMTFTNIQSPMTNVFQQQQMVSSVPFMLGGAQQSMMGLQGPQQPQGQFSVNMINSNGMPQQQQDF